MRRKGRVNLALPFLFISIVNLQSILLTVRKGRCNIFLGSKYFQAPVLPKRGGLSTSCNRGF